MDDDLPELLFRAYSVEMPDASGDQPNFDDLPAEARHAWKRVAMKARAEIGRKLAIDMRDAATELGAAQAIANLVDARLGTAGGS